jgi:inner membrane protein
MDSITQIVLGAATAEAVAGSKMKNRALLWGAIAGTIPDLDVLSRLWHDDLDGLVSHRGITHSILFTAITPWIFALLTQRFYQKGLNQTPWIRKILALIGSLFFIILALGSLYLSRANVTALAIILPITTGLLWYLLPRINRWGTSVNYQPLSPSVTYYDWVKLFFWCILTHWILDTFTNWGTQILTPFSNHRFALDNISVVDPIYTIPLAICLIWLSFHQSEGNRKRLNLFGLTVSSAYMALTFYNKSTIENDFQAALKAKGLKINQIQTFPLILNNALWACIAKTDTCYWYGHRSVFDKTADIKLMPIPKNHELLTPYLGDRRVEIVRWFCYDYHTVSKKRLPPSLDSALLYKNSTPTNFREYEMKAIASTFPQEILEKAYQANHLDILEIGDVKMSRFGDYFLNDPNQLNLIIKWYLIELDGKPYIYQNPVMPNFNSDDLSEYWKRIKGY